jgi:glycosyltransferase involved in cell wall biosynthesis
MKVLLTHEHFPPDVRGGGERVVSNVARHLAAQGVDVRVLTTGDPSITSFEAIPTVRLPVHRYLLNVAVPQVVKLARDVDLIQTFNYHACLPSLVAGKWLGKPVVCFSLGLFGSTWKDMRGPLAGRAFMAWERYLVSRDFTRFVCLSEYSRDLSVGLGMRRERSIVNRPGIDLQHYAPAPNKEDVVLFAGQLSVRKGIHDVLAVARALPGVRFRIAGWGPAETEVRRTATSNVEFIGWPGAKLRDTFATARIFLLPSRAEGLPVALLEAMASGCAVICTLPLEFEGIFVPAGNVDRLIDAVRYLWDHPEETSRIGQRNRERARTYDWDRHAENLVALYEEVLRDRRAETAA